MSTTERINTELTALQQELQHLRTYTEDIGVARDASATVLQASERFLTVFQTHVNSLVGAMENGAADFERTCTESSVRLTNAANRFETDIDRSHKVLDVLGKQLDAAAVRVEQMTFEIRLMDLPEKFAQVRGDIIGLDGKMTKAHSAFSQANERLIASIDEQARLGRLRFYVGAGIAIINFIFISYLCFR